MIAAALGRAEQGEALVAQADAAFAAAVAAHPEFRGRTGAVVLPHEGRYGAYFPVDARGRVMAECVTTAATHPALAPPGSASTPCATGWPWAP